MMSFHKTVMRALRFPHIKRGVLILLVRTKQGVIADEPGVFLGLTRPHPAVPQINGDILFFNFKKHQMDEHGCPAVNGFR